MKKSETIALYKEAFLEGKDEIDRRKFEEKSEDKQYGSIMAWKRRREMTAESNDKNSTANIASCIKSANKAVLSLPELSQKDAAKLLDLAESLASDIKNFDLIKKGQLLRKLKSQRQSIDREIELLENEGVKEY